MLSTSIGSAIRDRRKGLKITQPLLAELAGISTNTLYKLERGQGNPSLNILEKIVNVLGMEIQVNVKKTEE